MWYYIDTISNDDPEFFFPIVVWQNFDIYRWNVLLPKIWLPRDLVVEEIVEGFEVEKSENKWLSLTIHRVSQGFVFAVDGYGGCMSCTEFFGNYTLDGQTISIYYGTKYRVLHCEENESLIRELGLDYFLEENEEPQKEDTSSYVKYDFW